MLNHRELSTQIQAAFEESPSVSLTGPRRSGKTTLLRSMFPEATYVHLEEPDILEFARRDPRGFVRAHREPVILDEVQYAPDLLPYIKAEIDRHRSRHGRFLLTGSQSFALLDSMTESLAGRTVYLDLLSLSAHEASRIVRTATISELIFRGFYPELHASPALKSARFLRRLARTVVRREAPGELETAPSPKYIPGEGGAGSRGVPWAGRRHIRHGTAGRRGTAAPVRAPRRAAPVPSLT